MLSVSQLLIIHKTQTTAPPFATFWHTAKDQGKFVTLHLLQRTISNSSCHCCASTDSSVRCTTFCYKCTRCIWRVCFSRIECRHDSANAYLVDPGPSGLPPRPLPLQHVHRLPALRRQPCAHRLAVCVVRQRSMLGNGRHQTLLAAGAMASAANRYRGAAHMSSRHHYTEQKHSKKTESSQ